MSPDLSGRDIADICKDAERKWASKYIRKEVSSIEPEIGVYEEAARNRVNTIRDGNLRMEADVPQDWRESVRRNKEQNLAFGSK